MVNKEAVQVHDNLSIARQGRDQGKSPLETLKKAALGMGATAAEIIPTSDIRIEDHLAGLCKGTPPCENYGLSASCPPHVAGPQGFRSLQQESRHTMVVRIEVPSAGDILISWMNTKHRL